MKGQRVRLALLASAFLACGAATKPDLPLKIGEGEAVRLAAKAYNWPERYIWFDHREGSFFVLAPLGGEVEAPVTWLAVNPWTGDVWNIWRCERLSTAPLRQSQAAIRRRFPSDELRQYARLHAVKPDCYGP